MLSAHACRPLQRVDVCGSRLTGAVLVCRRSTTAATAVHDAMADWTWLLHARQEASHGSGMGPFDRFWTAVAKPPSKYSLYDILAHAVETGHSSMYAV